MVATIRSGEAVTTFRYLRISLVVSVAWLFISVAETAIATNCIQNSLSDFYYTASHAVFIGGLCTIGVALIVYQGSILAEEILLDFSGLLALVVAVVPFTPSPENNPKVAHACGLSLPTDADGTVGSANNLAALLVALVIGVVAYWLIRPRASAGSLTVRDPMLQPTKLAGPHARIAKWFLGFSRIAVPVAVSGFLIAGIVWFAANPDQFRMHAHNFAAVGLFIGIILVAVFYACYAALEGRAMAKIYGGIALVMAVTLAVIIVLRTGNYTSGRAVLWFEVVVITEFALFWLVQTRDQWHGRPFLARGERAEEERVCTPEVDEANA